MRLATAALSAALVISGGAFAQNGTMATASATPTPIITPSGSPPAPGFDGETPHSGDRYTWALNFLEASGYTGITNFKQDGTNFDATAWHDGHQVKIVANPDSRMITTRG